MPCSLYWPSRNFRTGFPSVRANQRTARRVSDGLHWARPTSHGSRTLVRLAEAALSRKQRASGWLCRKLAETASDSGPSMARAAISALLPPHASITNFLARRMVPTPIVIANRGTFSSPKKSAAASCWVTLFSGIKRVRESREEPGSLKPMCPVRPMPRIWISTPPAASIAAS